MWPLAGAMEKRKIENEKRWNWTVLVTSEWRAVLSVLSKNEMGQLGQENSYLLSWAEIKRENKVRPKIEGSWVQGTISLPNILEHIQAVPLNILEHEYYRQQITRSPTRIAKQNTTSTFRIKQGNMQVN